MRRVHSSTKLILVVAILVSGCSKDSGIPGLAKQHRAEVDAFTAKLLGVEAKLAHAPTDASGFKLAAGESLRLWGHDKPANTLVIEKSVFRDVIASHAVRSNFMRTDVAPETNGDLFFLVSATYTPRNDYAGDEANTVKVYKRVLAWYPNIRYVAVLLVTEKQDYTTADTSLAAKWHGRVAVFDLVGDAWVGAVAVALDGGPAEILDYVTVDATTNKEVSGPHKLLDRDISSALFAFNNLLDKAVKQALESGTSVTSLSQIPKG